MSIDCDQQRSSNSFLFPKIQNFCLGDVNRIPSPQISYSRRSEELPSQWTVDLPAGEQVSSQDLVERTNEVLVFSRQEFCLKI